MVAYCISYIFFFINYKAKKLLSHILKFNLINWLIDLIDWFFFSESAHYLSSQYLSDSSLSEDIHRFDFTGSRQFTPSIDSMSQADDTKKDSTNQEAVSEVLSAKGIMIIIILVSLMVKRMMGNNFAKCFNQWEFLSAMVHFEPLVIKVCG